MKLAVLGADDDVLDLVQWAMEQGGHEVVVAYDSEARANKLKQLVPGIRLSESWEELFLASVADAVVVGRGGKEAAARLNIDHAERRADQLRKLVQACVPMIVVCPACEAIVGFEIEMIRSDVGAIIIPYVPGDHHPAINRLHTLAATNENSEVGQIEQVSLEREQINRSREPVLEQFARDVTLLRGVIGFAHGVTASGPPAALGRDPLGPKPKELPDLGNLSVVIAGSEGLSARWSIGPPLEGDQAKLILIGNRGRAVVYMPRDDDWSLEVVSSKRTSENFDRCAGLQTPFAFLANESARGEPKTSDLWQSYCRDQEAAEAVDRSLARGRTIELFGEEHTEEQSFKGVMAMGGCLLLLTALGLVFFVVLVEALQLPIREWKVWRLWPIYLLVPIVAFLVLQFLQLAVKREDQMAPPVAN